MAPVCEETLGVPFLEAAPAVVVVLEATEGGLRTEAADPGRRVTVEARLMVVFGAVGCVWPLTGGEDGRGGMMPVLEPAPMFTRRAPELACGVDGEGSEVFLGTLVQSWQPYPCGTQQRVAVVEGFAVGAREEARDLSGYRPGCCFTGKEALLWMRRCALAWRLARDPRREFGQCIACCWRRLYKTRVPWFGPWRGQLRLVMVGAYILLIPPPNSDPTPLIASGRQCMGSEDFDNYNKLSVQAQ